MTKTLSPARRFALLVVALAVVWLGFEYWRNEVDWPQFPQPQAQSAKSALAPQTVLNVERDYGWRTGDLVPIELYIQQQPGTEVDLRHIAVTGDFEVHDYPMSPKIRYLADGTRLIKVEFNAQSLNFGDTRSLAIAVSYRNLDTGEVDTTPALPITVHISKTYDGRPDLQSGSLAFLKITADLWINILWLALGIAMIIGSYALWNLDIRLRKPEFEMAEVLKQGFRTTWGMIETGDTSAQHYEELERIVRRMFGLEPQTRGQIELQVVASNHPFQEEITTIIALCDARLYDHRNLTAEEHKEMLVAFEQILSGTPKRKPTLPAPAKASKPAEAAQVVETAVNPEVLGETAQAEPTVKPAETDETAQAESTVKPAETDETAQAESTVKPAETDETAQAESTVKPEGTDETAQAESTVKPAETDETAQAESKVKLAETAKPRVISSDVASVAAKLNAQVKPVVRIAPISDGEAPSAVASDKDASPPTAKESKAAPFAMMLFASFGLLMFLYAAFPGSFGVLLLFWLVFLAIIYSKFFGKRSVKPKANDQNDPNRNIKK